MPTLYLVATPIGNLEDVTLRALRVLGEVSLIAAEDTRTTRKLLAHHGVRNRLLSYNEHNKRGRTPPPLRAAPPGAAQPVGHAGGRGRAPHRRVPGADQGVRGGVPRHGR